MAETWFKREASGYITAKNKRAYLDRDILPALGGRNFVDVRRSDIAKLLDGIEDEHGPAAADAVLSIIRSITNWYAARSDDYVSPVVKKMRRTSNKERERDRVLNDDEIRLVWSATGTFASILKLCLLTGQRRSKVASMRWEDIKDGCWNVPKEARQKGTGGELALPVAALAIIESQPRFVSNPHVFPARGEGHFTSYSLHKARLGGDWTVHDCRRTARSLMSRAGVRPDIAERVLGHSVGGVAAVYDRHSYDAEKADALKRLAGLLELIVNPSDNVVPIRA